MGAETRVDAGPSPTERSERSAWSSRVVIVWSGDGHADDPLDRDLCLRMRVSRGSIELAREHWYAWDCWCVEWAQDCLRGIDAWAAWAQRKLPTWRLWWEGMTELYQGRQVMLVAEDASTGRRRWVTCAVYRDPEVRMAMSAVDGIEDGMRALTGSVES